MREYPDFFEGLLQIFSVITWQLTYVHTHSVSHVTADLSDTPPSLKSSCLEVINFAESAAASL